MRSPEAKSKRPARGRRPSIQRNRKSRHVPPEETPFPRVIRETQKLLASIGKPPPTPFAPDPFQLEALDRVLREDVVVSAPTGSGKTWIALEATKEYLGQGKGVWYATPLKALSNAKYDEFGGALGEENVGLLTGDRKENPTAPIIVGTTEILRNQLYDAMHSGSDLGVDLVILDEAHYLGDPDRGVVWEEVLIYLPERVRLLLLSATISNAHDLARWLEHIRNTPCGVVESKDRPVPLHVLFWAQSNTVTPFFRGNRLFSQAAIAANAQKSRRRSDRANQTDLNAIVEGLRELRLLPALIFLKSRSDCDRALEELTPSPLDPLEDDFSQAVREHIELYPELKNQRQLDRLLECRAGSHHAGQLPGWRLLIERMMVLGHLEVIFCTSTVAAGVNFPARTVVLLQSDRFNGQTFVDMTATDLHQMTGRAGRRGMDKAGFTLVVPGRYMNLTLVKDLLLSETEPLQSQIAVNFSMVLNLLLSHDPEGVKKLLGFSFAAFHQKPRKAHQVHRRLLEQFNKHLDLLEELDYVDERGIPTYDGKWAAKLRLDHPLLIAELIRAGEFSHLNPQELAALIAPFVMDRDREILISREVWIMTKDLWKRFRGMVKTLKPLIQFMIARGFPVPSIMFWPAVSAFLWAEEVEWDVLIRHISADEGDLAMLMLRTADHLRQLVSLADQAPELAATARKAIPLMVRPPLI